MTEHELQAMLIDCQAKLRSEQDAHAATHAKLDASRADAAQLRAIHVIAVAEAKAAAGAAVQPAPEAVPEPIAEPTPEPVAA